MSGKVNGDPLASSRQSIVVVFASGTKMVFNQTAAPTGWTKVTGSGNDTALRVTTGTVGTGGSVAFETAFASQSAVASSGAVAGHSLSIAELAHHAHVLTIYTVAGGGGTHTHRVTDNGTGYYNNQGGVGSNAGTGSGGAHTHSFTQPQISAINLDVSYVDVIIATKD